MKKLKLFVFGLLLISPFVAVNSQPSVESLYTKEEVKEMGDYLMNKLLPIFKGRFTKTGGGINTDMFNASEDEEMKFFQRYRIADVLESGYYPSMELINNYLFPKSLKEIGDNRPLLSELLFDIYSSEGSEYMKSFFNIDAADNEAIKIFNNKLIGNTFYMSMLFVEYPIRDLMYSRKLLPNEKIFLLKEYSDITNANNKEMLGYISKLLKKASQLK